MRDWSYLQFCSWGYVKVIVTDYRRTPWFVFKCLILGDNQWQLHERVGESFCSRKKRHCDRCSHKDNKIVRRFTCDGIHVEK